MPLWDISNIFNRICSMPVFKPVNISPKYKFKRRGKIFMMNLNELMHCSCLLFPPNNRIISMLKMKNKVNWDLCRGSYWALLTSDGSCQCCSVRLLDSARLHVSSLLGVLPSTEPARQWGRARLETEGAPGSTWQLGSNNQPDISIIWPRTGRARELINTWYFPIDLGNIIF